MQLSTECNIQRNLTRLLWTADELRELHKREAEQGIEPDWEIDAFMTADTMAGKREAIVSEYILKILGLDVRLLAIPMLVLAPPRPPSLPPCIIMTCLGVNQASFCGHMWK